MKRNTIILFAVLAGACASIAQRTDLGAELLKPLPVDPALTNLPPLHKSGPIHDMTSSLPRAHEPMVITKENQRRWAADFKIEMRRNSLTRSNLTVNVVIELKGKLEHLQTVDLYIGNQPTRNRLLAMHEASIFATLWRLPLIGAADQYNGTACASLVLSVENAKRAFLLLECQHRSATGRSRLLVGPTTLYAIDLNSFIPPPTTQEEQHTPEIQKDETLNINFVRRTSNKSVHASAHRASAMSTA